ALCLALVLSSLRILEHFLRIIDENHREGRDATPSRSALLYGLPDCAESFIVAFVTSILSISHDSFF
ncbi:hypothetical protein OH705_27240, partial [Pseudomonas sp. BJa3]|nr:hypothetical protein [Pseudomonas sp. BJa3]